MDPDREEIVISSDSDNGYDSDASTLDGETPAQLPRIESRRSASNTQYRRNRDVRGLLFTSSVSECVMLQDPFSRIHVGDTVELGALNPESEVFRLGDFGRVKNILRSEVNGKVTLRILRFRRVKFIKGAFDNKLNEVCLLLDEDMNDGRPLLEQCVEDVGLEDVLRKRKLIMTNQQFPALRCPEIQNLNVQNENFRDHQWNIRNSSQLVCRWAYVNKFQSSTDRKNGKHVEQILRPLHISECDAGCSIAEYKKFCLWRGDTNSDGPQYSFADAFCGCGGVTEAAKKAGLVPHWAVDKDGAACSTYAINNPNVHIEVCDVNALLNNNGIAWQVSVLHLSPPCQAFSRLNWASMTRDPETAGGRNDDENSAALFVIPEILDKYRPRIVTIEEVDNLKGQYKDFYHSLLRFFTSAGWSVRSGIVNFAGHSVPSNRKRLIVEAACPGESLPDFPTPTHGLGRSFPYVTLADALEGITTNHNRHNPMPGTRSNAPYSPNILCNTLTTAGSTFCHPSGNRPFTVRELARIQTFPDTFVFPPSLTNGACRKQIGNAVPTRGFAPFLEKVREALENGDLNRTSEMSAETQ